jgi:hypothetical protein
MKRISFAKILRIIIFIFAIINISILPLRVSGKGSGDKSALIPNEIMQNPAFQENDNSSLTKAGIFKKNVRYYSVVLILFQTIIASNVYDFQQDINILSPYFICYRTFTTYPIPPPSIS